MMESRDHRLRAVVGISLIDNILKWFATIHVPTTEMMMMMTTIVASLVVGLRRLRLRRRRRRRGGL